MRRCVAFWLQVETRIEGKHGINKCGDIKQRAESCFLAKKISFGRVFLVGDTDYVCWVAMATEFVIIYLELFG